MRIVFADAGYWIALLDPSDMLHQKALITTSGLGECRIVTSEMVLVEVFNHMSRFGERLRRAATDLTDTLWEDQNVEIIPQTSQQFALAARRYASRPDQSWGFTDCASFLVMEHMEIREALAHDSDFEQAGFAALLRES